MNENKRNIVAKDGSFWPALLIIANRFSEDKRKAKQFAKLTDQVPELFTVDTRGTRGDGVDNVANEWRRHTTDELIN